MTDPELADRTYVEPLTVEVCDQDHRSASGPTRSCRRWAGRPRSTCARARRGRRPRQVRRQADRRQRRGHREGRGSRAVQGRRWSKIGLEVPRSGYARSLDEARAIQRRPSTGSATRSSCARRSRSAASGGGIAYNADEFDEKVAWALAADAARRGAGRGVGARLEGVRARGDARPRRQRGHHLLDRELRSDGRAHRRLDHRRAGDDADRQGIPAHARRLLARHPRDRRRDRRLQHAVRRQSRRRAHGGRRDEPARVAQLGAGVEGDRLPHRQDRRASWPSATRSTRSRTTSRARRRRASSRPSTTSSSRCRASPSRSSPAPTRRSTTQMKSVGEVMAIGRTFRESLGKAIRSLETGRSGFDLELPADARRAQAAHRRCRPPSGCSSSPRRCALGVTVDEAHQITKIDPWFLDAHRRASSSAKSRSRGRALAVCSTTGDAARREARRPLRSSHRRA